MRYTKKPSNFFSVLVIVQLLAICFLFLACDAPNASPPGPVVVKKRIRVSDQPSPPPPRKKTEHPAQTAIASTLPPAKNHTQNVNPLSPFHLATRQIAATQPAVQHTAAKTLMAALTVPEEKKAFQEAPLPLYDPEGKIDPFMPLIKSQDQSKKGKTAEKPRRPRTPLERMDISQIKLVAIIRSKNKHIAMVEEATGKGYIISTDTYVGRNGGRVTKIFKDRLIVEEEVENVLGQVVKQEREMKLQKPPGEF